jgi:hypothetical protein
MGILSSPLNIYKPPRSTFNIIGRHVPLKDVESWLKRGQYVRFLREICPRKKRTTKDGRYMTAIAQILLRDTHRLKKQNSETVRTYRGKGNISYNIVQDPPH